MSEIDPRKFNPACKDFESQRSNAAGKGFVPVVTAFILHAALRDRDRDSGKILLIGNNCDKSSSIAWSFPALVPEPDEPLVTTFNRLVVDYLGITDESVVSVNALHSREGEEPVGAPDATWRPARYFPYHVQVLGEPQITLDAQAFPESGWYPPVASSVLLRSHPHPVEKMASMRILSLAVMTSGQHASTSV